MKIETHRSKHESNSFSGVILGYDLITQGYKGFNPVSSMIIITVNVQPYISSFYLTLQIDQSLFDADTSEEQSSKVITFPNPMIGEHDEAYVSDCSQVRLHMLSFNWCFIPTKALVGEAPMSPIVPQIAPPKCDLLDDFDTFETPSTSSLSTPSKEFAFRAAPSSLSKALQGPDKIKWELSIRKEYQSMIDNKVLIEVVGCGACSYFELHFHLANQAHTYKTSRWQELLETNKQSSCDRIRATNTNEDMLYQQYNINLR